MERRRSARIQARSSTFPRFFLDLPPDLTSLILLDVGPDATATLKSVNQEHTAHIRGLQENELCKHWLDRLNGSTGYSAPRCTWTLKIDVDWFFWSLPKYDRQWLVCFTGHSELHLYKKSQRTNPIPKLLNWPFGEAATAIDCVPSCTIHIILSIDGQRFESIGANQLPATLAILGFITTIVSPLLRTLHCRKGGWNFDW